MQSGCLRDFSNVAKLHLDLPSPTNGRAAPSLPSFRLNLRVASEVRWMNGCLTPTPSFIILPQPNTQSKMF